MTDRGRLVLLVTSPRVAPGLLSAAAWAVLRSRPVFAAEPKSLDWLTDADVRGVSADEAAAVSEVIAAAGSGTAVWWVGAASGFVDRLRAAAATNGVTVDVVDGNWDLPGAKLLDVVATMNRLRSPGGCPWDAKQDRTSLAPYLLEEAYEAFQAIEDRDEALLREELGDVLLQVAFHARIAEELPAAQRWTIDDVATGLVDKLVRRHPHVFADLAVADADEVNANWEAIKSKERAGRSPLSSVPMAAAALTLAATLQRKAIRAGLTDVGAAPLADAVAQFQAEPSAAATGTLLWSIVAACADAGVDAELALRAVARSFRDGIT